MANRRESVGRLSARTQSNAEAPVTQMVSVAVLPPRMKQGWAPPTGIGGAEAFSWDESINWQHNDKIETGEEVGRRKSFLRKAGITTQRKKLNPDLPPFVLRQVPYDTWRKHYAKDKEGNYKGTHAPAEDCLLKPNDVEKWRLGPAVTKGDRWTRGMEALPVYAEVSSTKAVPEYEYDYDGPPRDAHPDEIDERQLQGSRPASPALPEGEDYLDADDDQLVSHMERTSSRKPSTRPNDFAGEAPSLAAPASNGSRPSIARPHSYSVSRQASIPEEAPRSTFTADGKTAAQIIAEAEAKGKVKSTWKQMLSKGVQQASFGS